MFYLTKLCDHFFRLPVVLQCLIWFVLILTIKFDTLLAPPVWDTAMGVFPPAIFLYETNFNISELLTLPGWWHGGPNVHSLSLWTWFIAIVMTVTQDPQVTFFILHCFTFALNALAISLLVRTLFLMQVNSYLAITSGLLLLLIPLVLVQVGYMYTESPVMALSILVWVSWHHQREGTAVLLTLLAIAIKSTGYVIGLCILPLLFLRLIDKLSRKRLFFISVICLGIFIQRSLYDWLDGVPQRTTWGDVDHLIGQFNTRLNNAYDVTILIKLGMLASIIYLILIWCKSKKFNPVASLYRYCVKDGTIFIALSYPFIFCAGLIVSTYNQELFLYRYAIPIIPFVIISLALLSQVIRAQDLLAFLATQACMLSVYNYDGRLYSNSTAFSVVEHSHSYQDYVAGQSGIIEQIALLDNDTPIYVSKEIDYMTSHPMMGYLDEKKPNIIGIYKAEYRDIDIDNLPNQVYTAYSVTGHGGTRVIALQKTLVDERNWASESIFDHQYIHHRMGLKKLYKTN